jgi:hypothetical protein
VGTGRPGRLETAAADRFAEVLALEAAAAAAAGGRQLLNEDEDGARDRGPAEDEEENDEGEIVPRHFAFHIGVKGGAP